LDHFLIGREQFLRREYADALGPLDTAVRLDPSQTGAQLLMAVCYYNLEPKRLSEARSSLSVCIRSHPDVVGLYLLRALLYGEEGSQALARMDPERTREAPGLRKQAAAAFEAAEADYASALERGPSDSERYALLVNRGGMFLRAGQLDRSLADFE